MTAVSARSGQRTALWSLGFRPFFLAAGLWAPLALALWICLFATGAVLPSRFDPMTWHIHAMLFGFVLAAVAGFLLTAIPNWTGRPPVQGGLLAALVILWLAGRIACFISALLPLWLAAAVDLAFPFALSAVAAREIIAARNWRNVMIPVPIGVFGIADLLMYLELADVAVPAGLGWRLALVAIIILISVIGGRIIPAFTRNWLMRSGASLLPAAHGLPDRMALGSLHLGLLGWAFFPMSQAVGVILAIAAALNLWRLSRWRGWATTSEPLLTVLHLGYAWVVCGTGLLGASLLSAPIPEPAAVHALTAGAIGTMVLGVMTRVARGHTGRPLQADRITCAIYAAITLAGVTRVTAAIVPSVSMGLLYASAALWLAGFLLFVASYGPMLVLQRPDAGRKPV